MSSLDKRLMSILVCPQCKGSLTGNDEHGLYCAHCKLKYPVRDGIPIMLIEEAGGIRKEGMGTGDGHVVLPRSMFRVAQGPDVNMTFHLEQGSCRAIGRVPDEMMKTSIFNVDVALALDDSTRDLILKYISRQFKKALSSTAEKRSETLGQFRRAPDIVLTDLKLSKLHAMFFSDCQVVGILDLVSKNGTYVNGKEVESYILTKGDRIDIGESEIVYEG